MVDAGKNQEEEEDDEDYDGVADVEGNVEDNREGEEKDESRVDGQGEKAKTAGGEEPQQKAFDWHTNGLMIEFKDTPSRDPFNKLDDARTKKCVEKTEKPHRETLGQLASYAKESFAHQHRTHLFQLLIAGKFARFIRWDRAGAVVSDRFDYMEQPWILAEFFWQYSHMSDAERGWDMSVSAPQPGEVKLFRKAVDAFIAEHGGKDAVQRKFPGADDTLNPAYPPYKMTVPAGQTGQERELVIQKPFTQSFSPCGRATRAYLAYSLTDGELVFLKDGWRVDNTHLIAEDTIYALLADEDIPHIPTVLCAGDVKVEGVLQETTSQVYARLTDAAWHIPCSGLRRHIHHRIVQEIAYGVQALRNSKQFVQVLRDCLTSKSCVLY